ncbi:MAG TPA: hypothetical protein PK011_15530, partial [Marinagarivorans sp.]|nr:hypothetical protein [Marinagarivorans sp.]
MHKCLKIGSYWAHHINLPLSKRTANFGGFFPSGIVNSRCSSGKYRLLQTVKKRHLFDEPTGMYS